MTTKVGLTAEKTPSFVMFSLDETRVDVNLSFITFLDSFFFAFKYECFCSVFGQFLSHTLKSWRGDKAICFCCFPQCKKHTVITWPIAGSTQFYSGPSTIQPPKGSSMFKSHTLHLDLQWLNHLLGSKHVIIWDVHPSIHLSIYLSISLHLWMSVNVNVNVGVGGGAGWPTAWIGATNFVQKALQQAHTFQNTNHSLSYAKHFWDEKNLADAK